MATNTIGDVISRIRTQIKAVKQDALLTDRAIYSFVQRHAKWLMKREDAKSRLMGFSSVMQTMDYVELIEVDKIEAGCTGLKSGCTFRRTKEKVPIFMQGYWGPLIRSVTSLDGSEELQPTIPTSYLHISKSKNFKFNKTHYYWYLNEYLYFPDIEWDAVRIEGIFEDDISMFKCTPEDCVSRQDGIIGVPDFLLAELESNAFRDLMGMVQIPTDTANDKQSQIRS